MNIANELIYLGLTILLCTLLFVIIWIFDPVLHIIKPRKASLNAHTRSTSTHSDNSATNKSAAGGDGDGNTFFVGKSIEIVSNCNSIIEGPATIDISLVVPAYNESARIKAMLDPALQYLKKWCKENKLTFEIIVVDDKSTDHTIEVVRKYMTEYGDSHNIRLLALRCNLGKGGAVKQGVRRARGRYILMVDADGATDITELSKLYSEMITIQEHNAAVKDKVGVVVGSRAHMREANSRSKRSFSRTILTKGFHVLVAWLCTKNVRDTQCGFKLFTRQSARVLFSNLHLESWAFDTEIIYLAETLKYPIAEIAVIWNEVDGSKLIQSKMDVVTTSLAMARDMLCVRLAYLLGIWRFDDS